MISPSEPPGSPLIPSAPTKPIRYWFAMGDQDLFYPNPVMADGMHDWVLSAERMAKVLADKGYHYQFVFARNSKHVDRPTVSRIASWTGTVPPNLLGEPPLPERRYRRSAANQSSHRRVLFRRFWQDPWLFQAGEALQGLRDLLATADDG